MRETSNAAQKGKQEPVGRVSRHQAAVVRPEHSQASPSQQDGQSVPQGKSVIGQDTASATIADMRKEMMQIALDRMNVLDSFNYSASRIGPLSPIPPEKYAQRTIAWFANGLYPRAQCELTIPTGTVKWRRATPFSVNTGKTFKFRRPVQLQQSPE